MKFIIVTGGCMSGIGKGITASSIGAILKESGLKVTAIKIDPYINPDAGLMSPYEHGEVFVLDDGAEVDLDLGNYERYLDTTLTNRNNLTTGKLHNKIVADERAYVYGGRTVQVVPHVVDAIQNWIKTTASDDGADVAIVELGGTIGDIEGMPYLEAMRKLRMDVGRRNFICVHVCPILYSSKGEAKTKTMQRSIEEMRARGLTPSIMVCRGRRPNGDLIKKISTFSEVSSENIFFLEDLGSIYQVPIEIEAQGAFKSISELLRLEHKPVALEKWRKISEIATKSTSEVSIALVGKYTDQEDCYTSVIRALQHACYEMNSKPKIKLIMSTRLEANEDAAWEELKSCSCLIVPGGFDKRGVEGMILAIQYARENRIPFLGVCLGFQLSVIEYARNVLGIKEAQSQEFDSKGIHFIIEMLEYKDPDNKMGGTMRLGARKTQLIPGNTIARGLYGGADFVVERHRHRYEVNPIHVQALENGGLQFTGKNEDGVRMEILELDMAKHPFYFAVQYHPEFLTRPYKPSPPYSGLIKAASNKY